LNRVGIDSLPLLLHVFYHVFVAELLLLGLCEEVFCGFV
jgi:hypothetical protein